VSSRRLYIYYRVQRDSVAQVAAAVRQLQAGWQLAMPGLRPELLQRADESGDVVTLMETYWCADGVHAAWQELIGRDAKAKLSDWLVAERQVEVFEPCA